MPTPVGHTVTALAAWGLVRPWSMRMLSSPWFYLVLFSAFGPDFDFIPGLLLGDESLFHRSGSHSFAGAALYGLALFAVALAATRSARLSARAAAAGEALYLGHLFLDLLGEDPGAPYGIQLFWPWSEHFFISPVTLFPHLDRHPFDVSVISRGLPVALAELLLLAPLLLLAYLVRARRTSP